MSDRSRQERNCPTGLLITRFFHTMDPVGCDAHCKDGRIPGRRSLRQGDWEPITVRITQILESRRKNWIELEHLMHRIDRSPLRQQDGNLTIRFAELYRCACADLAMAQTYQLPEETSLYLHQLVGQAHNLLYSSEGLQTNLWYEYIRYKIPALLYRDHYFWIAAFFFWSLFITGMFIGFVDKKMADQIVGEEILFQLEEMHAKRTKNESEMPRTLSGRTAGVGFYIKHNTSIGMQCFASGILCGVGSLIILAFNAILLGVSFGYMASTDTWNDFFTFVLAHGPFELTAVVLSGAAGLRLGLAIFDTGRRVRQVALREEAAKALQVVAVAAVLFLFAAIIEGLVSGGDYPWIVRLGIAILSIQAMLLYVVYWGQQASKADANSQ